jgi:hypothetical protein
MAGFSVLIGPSPDGLRIAIYTTIWPSVSFFGARRRKAAAPWIRSSFIHRLFIINQHDSAVNNRFSAKRGQLKHIVVQARTGKKALCDIRIGNPGVLDR